MAERSSLLPGQLGRFILLGGTNTLLTYLLLLALATVVDERSAYTLAFLAGVVFNAVLTGPVVFSSRPGRSRVVLYVGWLLGVYAAGLMTIHLAVVTGVGPPALLAALPLLITAPLSFAGGRLLLSSIPHQLPQEDMR